MCVVGAAAGAVTLAIASCDIKKTGHDQAQSGGPINVIGSNIEGAAAEVAADGVIQLAFDRYLLPSTVTRQGYAILDANHAPLPTLGLRTIYDPIARTVSISGPDGPGRPWLTQNLTYHLVLDVPPDDDNDQTGFRAIDRAALAAPRDFTFRAGPETKQTLVEPKVDFCADLMPIFYVNCSGGTCHQSATAAMSLVLATPDGIRLTARDRVAQGSNTGSRAGTPSPPGRIFGVDMPLIEPFDPGSSWLMYKIDLKAPTNDIQDPNAFCLAPKGQTNPPRIAAPFAPLATPYRPASDDERELLGGYIPGREMPYPHALGPSTLSFQQREIVRMWIAQGAEILPCKGCDELHPGDGGSEAGTVPPSGDAGDAGSNDAGSRDAADAD